MSTLNIKGALIASSFLLAAIAAPNTFAQAFKTNTGLSMLANPIGILPPPPLPITVPIPAPTPLENHLALYTQYEMSGSYSNLSWFVCGTNGCYALGQIGPFAKIGAVMEGPESTDYNTGTVTRDVYVVDQAATDGTYVVLDVYRRTDVITLSSDTVTIGPGFYGIWLMNLTGSIGAQTYMAANDNCLFIGTNQSSNVYVIQKSNFTYRYVSGASPIANMSAITNDRFGNVFVTFGNGDSNSNYVSFGPTCLETGAGSGAMFTLNGTSGVSTGGSGNLITSAVQSNNMMRLRVHPSVQTTSQAMH
ncbi:hypothetical protein [Dyella sp. 2HG41-7]|uniref:hypothetical protein n=1 Tax=Dyella sp. 2HG41-7 TaxID=2883239 RepID=UPI001F355B30|nr:hypothetical protein [Dyella sp. 2HG41-7]